MENGIFTLFFIAVIATIIFFAFKHSWNLAAELDDAYQRLARRRGGRSTPGGIFGKPVLRFPFSGMTALVNIATTGGERNRYYTQLHLRWPDSDLRCEVYPEGLVHGVGKLLGMKDIQIGSPAFDPKYMITGNSEDAIRRLLTVEVQREVEALRDLLGNNDIYVSLRGGRLLIKKRGLIRSEATLDRFIQIGLRLYEAAAATNAEGIDFVHPEQTEATLSLTEATCQVCGDDIRLDAVFCRSCKTPHHHDCWQYYGSCSTYGCGQTRFLVAKQRGFDRMRPSDHKSPS